MLDELFTKLAEKLDTIRIRNYSGSGIKPLDDMLSRFNLEICKTFDKLESLQAENQALRNELEALKGATMGVDLSKDYINKIKTDAVRELIREEMTIGRLHNGQKRSFIFVSDATEYANKLEPPK